MKPGMIVVESTIQQPNPSETAQEQPTEDQRPVTSIPSGKTPQEFYAEITKRADVRAILEELATG